MGIVVRAQLWWAAALLLLVPGFAVGSARRLAGDAVGYWVCAGGLALIFLVAGAVRRAAELRSPRSFPRKLGNAFLLFPAVILFAAASLWVQ